MPVLKSNEEITKAIETAGARAPDDYTTYYLLRAIAAGIEELVAEIRTLNGAVAQVADQIQQLPH
jgi:hypothetical protein